ncbi:MAG TPA: HD domain-containing phosphohydrolase [Alphaproteobacteria bacterium]|jgi:HD-GYP domain-containing protein (c-di-GMP phosphodiesterase class II)
MSLTSETSPASSDPRSWGRRLRPLIISCVILAAVLALGVIAALALGKADRERELRSWQNRLSIVADSRFADISTWLERQFDELTGIAANTSVQLYMTELSLANQSGANQPGAGAQPQEPAQATYLRNLLTVTAERARFSAAIEGADVPANVRRLGVAGLALLDRDHAVVTQTAGMPPFDGDLGAFIAGLPRDKRAVLDLYRNGAGRPAIGFAVPVFAVQGGNDATAQVGWVVGVKEVADELYPLLRQPGEVFKTAENLLVRQRGASVDYLSPLADGTAPLTRTLAASTTNLAEAAALAHAGDFAEGRDYRDQAVLHTSRPFSVVPWTLVSKIGRDEALSASDQRRTQLVVLFALVAVLVAAVIFAAWWYGSSRQASRAAGRYKRLADEHERQGLFLKLVADSQPTSIFILDGDGRYGFANEEAARHAGLPMADLVGKPVGNVLGPEAAKPYLANAARARSEHERQRSVIPAEEDTQARTRQVDYIPIGDTQYVDDGVLVVERDITAEVQERAKRERALLDLVRTLVALVDKRDPYAAHHSVRVAMVAQAVAREMGLNDEAVQTVGFAGSLMNLGKILVPTELLTKTGQLNDEELGRIRDSLRATADFLEGIDFGGPVVETLRQLSEHWDGSGKPNGLAGEAILPEARAVAVANAFVALASPRAYRAGVPLDAAIDKIRQQAGSIFDRRAVTALENSLENRGGREAWADFGKQA